MENGNEEELFTNWTIDFLNLVFGQSEEHDLFMNEIVFPDVKK